MNRSKNTSTGNGKEEQSGGCGSNSNHNSECDGVGNQAEKEEAAAPQAEAALCAEVGVHMSKNQLKRAKKRQMLQAIQKEKKRKAKEARLSEAIAAGRDLDAERKFVLERTMAGDRQRRLSEIWEGRIQDARKRFQICIDCSFEKLMTEREIASLVQQLRYCYSYNKKSPNPCLVAATSISRSGRTRKLLEKEAGFTTWHQRAYTCTEESLENYYNPNTDPTVLSKIVYLTSDSATVLNDLEDDKIYVIGGIVDRNRLKGVAMDRAKELGVSTAQLPLDKHLSKMTSTRVLTCNHVFDLLLRHRENNNDWGKALQQVLPSRKDAHIKKSGEQ